MSLHSSRHHHASSRCSIVVPMYMYPLTSETWQPLHRAIATHPELQFLVIVNPNSGPGGEPDASYARELPKLNERPNVRTIGYVRTNYCKRKKTDVVKEVETYAAWRKDLAVSGIFLDESPNHYSEKVAAWLDSVTRSVKNTNGILGDRLVIHNPGTPPDDELRICRPEVTVVFEQSYERYQCTSAAELAAMRKYERSGCCYILHSVPHHEVKRVTQEMRRHTEFLFITDLQERYYERFGQSWEKFVDAMQAE